VLDSIILFGAQRIRNPLMVQDKKRKTRPGRGRYPYPMPKSEEGWAVQVGVTLGEEKTNMIDRRCGVEDV
jgi:hypothetical protein